MRISNELQIGKAGEYLACADLITKGFVAFPSEQGLPYDVILDCGIKPLRVQVKTCTCPRAVPQRSKSTTAYIFNVKRRGKRGKALCTKDEVDLFALVCLDTRQVAYVKNDDMPTTINLRVDSLRGTYYDEKGIQDYAKVIELAKIESNQSEIARKIGLHIATVNRMLQAGYTPYQTSARYFSDFIRSNDWFLSL